MFLHGCSEVLESSLVDAADEVVESLVMGADAYPALPDEKYACHGLRSVSYFFRASIFAGFMRCIGSIIAGELGGGFRAQV